jgi:hypothetical protein
VVRKGLYTKQSHFNSLLIFFPPKDGQVMSQQIPSSNNNKAPVFRANLKAYLWEWCFFPWTDQRFSGTGAV